MEVRTQKTYGSCARLSRRCSRWWDYSDW